MIRDRTDDPNAEWKHHLYHDAQNEAYEDYITIFNLDFFQNNDKKMRDIDLKYYDQHELCHTTSLLDQMDKNVNSACLKKHIRQKDKSEILVFYPSWFQRGVIIYYYFVYVYVKSQNLINLYFIITKL